MILQHRQDGGLPEESGRSPNELDQTDESQKAADITRAAEAWAAAGAKLKGQPPTERTKRRPRVGRRADRNPG